VTADIEFVGECQEETNGIAAKLRALGFAALRVHN
jgi:hypothetical protein